MSRATPPQALSPVLQSFRRIEYPRMLDVHDCFKSVSCRATHTASASDGTERCDVSGVSKCLVWFKDSRSVEDVQGRFN
ncbi:hypothetical protein TNCV_177961 [Trichonephila clavipes]|nr:hypothetical protein TNCV_177961 [Trichonephila clavipes]